MNKNKHPKCPKCGSEMAILRGEPHGLSPKELNQATKQIKSGKVFGYVCLKCGYKKKV